MPAQRTQKVKASSQPRTKKVKANQPDGSYIARPKNQFILFRCSLKERKIEPTKEELLLYKNPSKWVSALWRSQSDDVKMYYAQLAEEEKLRHAAEHPNYVFRPRPRGRDQLEQSESSSSTTTTSGASPTWTNGSGTGGNGNSGEQAQASLDLSCFYGPAVGHESDGSVPAYSPSTSADDEDSSDRAAESHNEPPLVQVHAAFSEDQLRAAAHHELQRALQEYSKRSAQAEVNEVQTYDL
ncbi:hypothetical protein H0H93_015738, partial [Arthromyces matolae]